MMNEIPDDFVLYTEWPEFMSAEMMPRLLKPHYVGENPSGLRRNIGPLCVEGYVSDKEPLLNEPGPSRIVIWERLGRTDIPPNWSTNNLISRMASSIPYREGFAIVDQDGSHFTRWAPTERARRRRWHEVLIDRKYRIVDISGDEFWTAYKTSSTWKKIRYFYRELLRQMFRLYQQNGQPVVYRVVRRIDTGEIVAGMATLDSLKYRGSYYFIGFLCDAGRTDHAMTALMDDWFTRSSESGIRYVQLGHFWGKDSPENWKGFSDFKAKFTTHYIDFPPLLVRFVRRSRLAGHGVGGT